MESDALVTVSAHVPTARAVTTPEVIAQLADPMVTDKVTDPVPEPPVTDTMMPVYRSPLVVATESAVCDNLLNVTVVADELELSTLNSILGLHSHTGRWVTYKNAHSHQVMDFDGDNMTNCRTNLRFANADRS